MSSTSPVRFPDLRDPAVMTRRAWILVALNVLIPGSAQLLAGNRRLGRFGVATTFVLWGLVVAGVLLYFLSRPILITISTNVIALWAAQIVAVFYLGLWVILTFDTLRLLRLVRVAPLARGFVAGVLVFALVGIGAVSAYGIMIAGVTRSTIDSVFADGEIAEPIDGRYNIMLLGGDAGPDRAGLRPDSISVVSINADTGEVTILGLPRNLEDAPFVAGSPMAAAYPNGYGVNGCAVDVCMLNSIYTEVTLKSPEMYPTAVADGSDPGIEAMRDAVEGVLGITVQYYVLIDMQGFSQLIDALGGVTITSQGRYPIGGDVDSAGNPINVGAWIEPGLQKMDGNTALWYARSRHGTSDYDRMSRQREVQEAILQQFDPANVLSKFQAVAEAGAEVVRTDVPQGMLGRFVDLAAKARQLPIEKIDFVPPITDPEQPDFDYLRQVVAENLAIVPAEG